MPIWAKTPGIDLGADAAVDRGDRAVAARALPAVAVLLAAAAGQQARAGELLDADGEADVGTRPP
jgi:hypothetical protein